MFTMSQEAEIFIWSVICGVVIMIIYDFFSVPRKSHFSVLTCNVFDSSFVIIATGIMFFVIFSVANGCVRAYEFIGAFLGGILYKLTLGKVMPMVFYKIIRVISLFFWKIFNFLLTPIKFMYKIIYSIIGVLCRGVRKITSTTLSLKNIGVSLWRKQSEN